MPKKTRFRSISTLHPAWMGRMKPAPSSGDTSYAGGVLRSGQLVASYYTNDIALDYPWILGRVLPSEVRIARIPLQRLAALGATPR